MTTDDLDRLEQIANAATPGPWAWRDSGGMFVTPGPVIEGSDPPRLYPYGKAVLLAQYEYDTGADIDASDEDRGHIAAFHPETAQQLITALRTEREARATAERERDALARALDRAWGAVRAGLEADAYRAGKWDLAHAIEHRVHDLAQQVEALRQERETLDIKLAGCGVAALSNTDETRAQRIGRDNPYWSASYGDVCNAVDREMALRAALTTAQQDAARLREALVKAWQSIETAPRDGAPILGWCPAYAPPYDGFTVARWVDGVGVGWVQGPNRPCYPTHWTSLPGPPALTAPTDPTGGT